MMALALEYATSVQSAAILLPDRTLAEIVQPAHPEDRGRLMTTLESLRQSAGVAWSDVALFAVGLGPGAFTALRMALATAHGLALPGGCPVLGIASAEAVAIRLGERINVPRLLLCGDARRGLLWCAAFQRSTAGWIPDGDFELVTAGQLAARVDDQTVVGTSDWPQLAPTLREALPPGRLIEEPVYPAATDVGRLAFQYLKTGRPSRPLTPIYLHPPVVSPPTGPLPHHA